MCNSTDNAQIEAMYPLSPLQKGLLFHSLSIPGMYLQQILGDLPETIDIPIFKQAWQRVIQRHDLLRTSFHWEGLEHPQQKVHPQINCPLQVYDWSSWPTQAQEEQLTAYLKTDRIQGFQFTHPPLMRLALFQLGKTHYRFLWTFHHAILDEYSHFEILREVFAFYEAFCLNQDLELPLPHPYRDYIAWLETQNFSEGEAFWRNIMGTCEAPTSMIDGWPKESLAEGLTHATQILPLTLELGQTLQTFAEDQNLTIHILIQGAWAFLLSRYSREEQVLFGATRSCRHWGKHSETMIGLFINTLPVSSSLQSDIPVLVWLQTLHEQWLKMQDYEHTPLIELHKWSHIPKTLPLFESIVLFEQNHFRTRLKALGGKWKKREFNSLLRELNYPCTLLATLETSLQLHLIYDVKHFSSRLIKQMLGHLEIILSQIVAHPDQCLGELSLLSEVERHQLLIEWNATQAFFPQELCIQQLFEAQVEKTPEAIAVVFKNQFLTYRELNQRANQLAHYLHTLQFEPETPIGLCVERSLDMMIGIFGILKAGGVYVPLNPTYPKERITYILKDSQMPVLLTQGTLRKQFSEDTTQIISLDTQWDEIAKYSHENLYLKVPSHHLSYIIYTSGTTGDPKGVMVEHRSVLNLLAGLHQEIYIHYPQIPLRVSLNGPLAFDTSIKQIIQLLAGHTLDILPEEIRLDGKAFLSYVQEHKIDVLDSTPSQLKLLISEGLLTSLESPQCILVGGEAIDMPLWKTLAEVKTIHFYNVYGPTECTVDATISSISGKKIPVIGRPITNTQIYLLDTAHHPVPIGVPGELHIGGVGLARGYLNKPDLTAEKFIPNPFSDDPSARLYKTGDLARYLPDGNIEYLGRIDTQVKLRGFRIELGEIEALLTQHEAVKEAVVIVREDSPGDKRLVGYVVFRSGRSETANLLRQFLKDKLPEYMVPATIVFLEVLPLTPNGKIDRRALPKPDYLETKENFVAPRNEIELQLQRIWEEILQVRPIGMTQNFFELGGHSLLAIRLLSHLGKTFGKAPSVMTLFQSPTIEQLAHQLHEEHCPKPYHIPPRPSQDLVPLSFAQQRLWFIEQLEPNSSLYHIAYAFELKGQISLEALQQSLSHIVTRHEVLRTQLPEIEGQPWQIIAQNSNIELTVLEVQEHTLQHHLLKQVERPFNFAQDLLLRASLLRIAPNHHVLLLVLHHIASDGWSTGILFRELLTLYQAFLFQRPSPLPPLPIQYADFAHWQRQWLTGDILESQLNYWKKQLAGIPTLLELPLDHPRPSRQTFVGKSQNVHLHRNLTQRLYQLAQQTETTLFMTLLAAFATLLGKYTRQEDIVIGSPIANRTHAELEPLIGFFVNTLVLRADLSGDPTFRELSARVKQTCLEAYMHQELPFERLVEVLQPERHLGFSPLFQVMFILQNTSQEKFELPNLAVTPFPLEFRTAKFDLTVSLKETPEGLTGSVEYNTALFEETTVHRWMGHFQKLLEDIVEHPYKKLSQLEILSDAERHQLLVEWTPPPVPFPVKCVHHLFEEQVEKTPTTIAVVFEGQSLTYRELNQQANQLAHYLRTLGVQPEVLVGICVERSLEMVIGLLGILKAGGAYVPLDITYPQERLKFMLENTQATLLLTQPSLSSLFSDSSVLTLYLDKEKFIHLPTDNLHSSAEVTHLAYVIYTSGSTGQPKGIAMEHRSLSNLITWQMQDSIIPKATTLQFSPISFDVSFQEIFSTWCAGGTLVLISEDQRRDISALLNYLVEHSIERLFLPFVALQHLAEVACHSHEPQLCLREIITAGEQLQITPSLRHWLGKFPEITLHNQYGPSESHVVTKFTLSDHAEDWPSLPPIGRPLVNTQIYILNQKMEPVPIGVPGELYIGGIGLARGYLNRPELTHERFISNPLDIKTRLYKTGDLARYLPDGNIEYLGRIDTQVKLRGFRIELGEIETTLLQHSAVSEAVVIVREDIPGDKRLVGYVVLHSEMSETPNQLRQFLKEKLPEYMVPSVIVLLERLPLTPNGKIDRRALPKPEHIEIEETFVAPRNEIELQLQRIWEEVLQVRPIGVTQNFFELGGHSLLIIKLLAAIKKTFKKALQVFTVFQAPTIEQLASILYRQNYKESLHQTLIFIQPQGNRPPLFFVGSTNFGHSLVQHLGDHQPIYGLNIFGLMGSDEIETLGVQMIARQFIQAIRSIQIHGPYHLCAYCGDGGIAFEIAQQLNIQREKIAFLGFIDVLWQKRNRYKQLWHNLLKFGPLFYSIHISKRKLKFYTQRWLNFEWNAWKMRWYRLCRTSFPPEVRQVEFVRKFFSSLGNYSPQPYSGKVTLFLSAEWYTEELNQFSQILQGGIELHEVPGYHDTLFVSPQVEVLGNQLKECLDKLNMLQNTPPAP